MDLNNVIRSTHGDNKQLIFHLLVEFSSTLPSLTNSAEFLTEVFAGPHKKRRAKQTDKEVVLAYAHDWMKTKAARNMFDVSRGTNILPSTKSGSSHSCFVLLALYKFRNIASHSEVVVMLNKHVHVGQPSLNGVSYLTM